LVGQFLSSYKWCLTVCADAAVGRAGKGSQYTRSGVRSSPDHIVERHVVCSPGLSIAGNLVGMGVALFIRATCALQGAPRLRLALFIASLLWFATTR